MNDRSSYSIVESGPGERSFVLRYDSDALGDEDGRRIWILVLSGLLWGLAVASLACGLPDSHTLSARTILARAVVTVALSLGAGAAGVWVVGRLFRLKPSGGIGLPLAVVLPGALFMPGLVFLYRQESWWTLLLVGLLTVMVTLGVRRILPQDEVVAATPVPSAGELPNLYGLPAGESRYRETAVIALCAQAAVFCGLAGLLFLANALFALALHLLLRLVPLRRKAGAPSLWKRTAVLSFLAILLTVFALLPWMGGHLVAAPVERASSHALANDAKDDPGAVASDYVGIILLPPAVKKHAIVPPAPRLHTMGPGRLAKPMVIPFDGAYWYFKAPATGPGPHAHLAHGMPTEANVRSSDRAPLFMQAHQELGTPIDLDCCSAIEVALTNADTRPGGISLGVLLSDSASHGKSTLYLGAKVVPSSVVQTVSLTREPVKETVRFAIPASGTLSRFDEITVVYLPSWERDLAGAKLSLQSFTLIPR